MIADLFDRIKQNTTTINCFVKPTQLRKNVVGSSLLKITKVLY